MRLKLGIAGLVLGLATAAAAFAQMGASYRFVAFTGLIGPAGVPYQAFGLPTIGEDGTVAFFESESRQLDVNPRVFAERLGVTRIVATLEQTAPGTNATFAQFTAVSVASDGRVAVNARLVPFEAESSQPGVSVEGGGTFGLTGNTSFLDLGPASFRAGRELYVKGNRDFGNETITPLAAGLSAKGLNPLVTVGEKLPGPGESALYVSAVNGNESITYEGDISGVGDIIDATETGAVALKVKTSPSPSNTPAPLQTIYAGKPGDLRFVARSGDMAPALPSFYLSDLSPAPSIAGQDRLAFAASLTFVDGNATGTPGVRPSAVFAGRIGELAPILVAGAKVPTTSDVVFSDLSLGAVTNETGDVVFKAKILYTNGGVRTGFWIKRADGDPVLLAVDGMELPTPGGNRTVDHVDFAGPGTFNGLHQFAFRARFSNGDGYDEGIYLADTRAMIPWVRVSYPRQARDRVTRAASITIRGVAIDETGIDKVEYTVLAEKKRGGKAPTKRRLVPRLAKGDRKWEFTVPLALGINRIAVTATDKLGNVSEPLFLAILRY